MKIKFLLPVLAMIFAIGMSFTPINKAGDFNTDYILVEGVFQPLGMEYENCGSGNLSCKVKIDGQDYKVYNDAHISTLKSGDGVAREL